MQKERNYFEKQSRCLLKNLFRNPPLPPEPIKLCFCGGNRDLEETGVPLCCRLARNAGRLTQAGVGNIQHARDCLCSYSIRVFFFNCVKICVCIRTWSEFAMCSTHMPIDIANVQAGFVNMCECAHTYFFRLFAIPMFGQGDSPPYLHVSGLSAGLSRSVGAENRNCFVRMHSVSSAPPSKYSPCIHRRHGGYGGR